MAKVELEFDAQMGPLRQELGAVLDLLVEIRDASKENAAVMQADAAKNVKSAQTLETALVGAVDAAQELAKTDTSKLTKGLDTAADTVERFESGAENMDEAFRVLIADAKKVAKEQGVIIQGLDKQTDAAIDLLQAMGGVTKEEAKLFKEATAVLDSFEKSVEPVKSLRTETRLAKEEFDRLIEASDGRITPELIAAGKRAGELQDRVEDLGNFINAFNPDKKFQTFANVLGNVASGFQAAVAGAGLLGGDTDDLQRSFLRLQQVVAFVQGLQGFFGGLADNIKAVRTLLVATTVAQQQNTVATVADTAAKGAQATATGAAAAATTGLSATIRGLTATLLASPLAPFVAILVAAGAAFVLLTRNTRDFNAEVEELNKSLDETTQKRLDQIDQNLRLQTIQNEREALRAGETEAAKRRQAELDYLAKREALVKRQLEFELNIAATAAQLRDLEGENSSDAIEARQKALDNLKEYRKQFKAVGDEIIALTGERTNAIIGETNKVKADRKKDAEDAIATAKKLNDELAGLERDLQQRLRAAQLAQASPRERLILEKQAADEEVELLAQKFREINKLRTGQATLTVEQDRQLDTLRLANIEAYWKAVEQLDIEGQKTRLSLEADPFKREREQLEIDLRERAELLRRAKVAEAEIQADADRSRTALLAKQSATLLDQEEAYQIALINQRIRGQQTEEAFEEQKGEAILRIQLEFAKKRLAALKDDGTETQRLLIAQAQATVAGLENAIRTQVEKKEPFHLFKALGFDFTEEEKQAVVQGVQEVIGLINATIAAQQMEVQAQIAATDAIIADRERRSQDLQSRLANEIALAEAGFASNVDLVRQQIAENDAAAAAEKQRREQLLAEQRRIAKQQLAIDAVVQASSLATAAAKVFATEGKLGIPGIIAAIGIIASMVAAFVSLKARAKAIAAEGNQQFEEGGWIEGPSHKRGGVTIEAEGGEYMVRKKRAKKFAGVLEGINEDNWNRHNQMELAKLVESAGLQFDKGQLQQIVDQKKQFIHNASFSSTMDTKRLEKKVMVLTEEVRGLRGDHSGREETYSVGDRQVTKKPGKTVRKHG